MLELNGFDPKIRDSRVLEKIGAFIRSILPDDSIDVQIKSSIRINRTEQNVEPRLYRLPKVILGSEKP